MDNINWNDALFISQILIWVGAILGHLKFCVILVFIEMAFIMFIAFPLFIFWSINAIFGGEVAFIAALLAFAFIAYYFYSERQLKKKFKDLYDR
ncbi:MAG: hypothetical protein [Bacteriophage sp.]|jgi:hypothetical protein|nr:MAG: hypothetical protein [Bacteriophage sp.]